MEVTEVERRPARLARSRRNHIGSTLRAFFRFARRRCTTGSTSFEAKWGLIRYGHGESP